MCFNRRRLMVFSSIRGNRTLSPLQINNTTIEIVHNVKNLGVIFNNSLNWSNHIKCYIASAIFYFVDIRIETR